jgi:hypothetical protein
MFSFFKRKSKYPPFRVLWTFDKRNSCFIKNAEWGWLDDEQIFVTDPRSLKTTALEQWEQLVFLSANGQVTVTEFVKYIADQYADKIPETLDHTIIDALLNLAGQQLIKFSPSKQPVPQEFEQPGLKG